MTATTTSSTPAAATRSLLVRGTLFGLGLALIANAIVFAVGSVGAPIQVVTGSASAAAADLRLGEVIATTVVALLLGTLALWLFDRRRGDGLRSWTVVAAVVAVLSALPLLRLDVDAGSKVALVTMHLATGAAAVVGHTLARRR
jgi:L-lactate permease